MQFRIYTLVDVTMTGARRGQDPHEYKQQQNFDTLCNVIGLRTNPSDFKVEVLEDDVKQFKLGNEYKGKHKVWQVDFYVEAAESTNVDFMIDDFELVPVITNLDETAKLNKDMFNSSKKSKYRNIIFEQIDK